MQGEEGCTAEGSAPSNRNIVIVLIANGLLRVANAAGGALIGFYLASLAKAGGHTDAALVGNLGAVTSGAELLMALPMGTLADRYAPRMLLMGGALLGGLATQIFGISHLIALFLLSRVLEDIAAAAGTSPLLAHLADATRSRSAFRSKVMGGYELSLLAGLALGALVGGTLWEQMRTHAFSVLAVIYLLAGVLFYAGANASHTSRSTPSLLADLRQAWADPFLRKLAPAWIAMTAMVGMWLTHITYQLSGPSGRSQYLVGRFSPREVGIILLGYALVFAVGVTLWSFVPARMARLRALRITLTAMLLACLWLTLLNHSAEFSFGGRGVLLALAGLSILIESGFTPTALAYLADIADKGEGRGAAMGIYSLLLGIGSVLGALLGGLLAHALAFDGLLLGTVALVLLALFLLPQESRDSQDTCPIQQSL